MSRTAPSSSTARHRYIRMPSIWTTISSRCHRSLGRGAAAVTVAQSQVRTLAPNFGGDVEPALGREFLDVAVAQREAQVESNGVLDDTRRKAVTAVGDFSHPISLPRNLAPDPDRYPDNTNYSVKESWLVPPLFRGFPTRW